MGTDGLASLNLLIYAFCCYVVWKTCPSLQANRWTVLILAIAFPGFFHLVAWGQTSGLALLCFTLAFLALENDQPLLAGLADGSLDLLGPVGTGSGDRLRIHSAMEGRRWRCDGSDSSNCLYRLGCTTAPRSCATTGMH